MPVVFLPHGGGPLPVLGDERHAELVEFLRQLGRQLPRPKAIVVVSAHWEENVATVSSHPRPPMIYDYSGFPPASYELRYDASGEPRLAAKIVELLSDHGIPAASDANRGFDHGTFIPLMLMYPKADIPIVQLSLVDSLQAARQYALGEAIAPLSHDGVLLIGSGMSFHNMAGFMRGGDDVHPRSVAFDQWLHETLTSSAVDPDTRRERLLNWHEAPEARYCHPREEHLLPLHVCQGAADGLNGVANRIYVGDLLGARVSAYCWR